MNTGEQLAEGKTKIIYAHPSEPGLVLIRHKDGITAGDGARRNTIPGKGALSGRTTAAVFRLLARAGISSHFVDAPAPDLMLARRCVMIPLEVVTRRLATGSYLRRTPDAREGQRFDPPLVEFFLKDDARHDPLVSPAEIVRQGIADAQEIAAMEDRARAVFGVLERAWAAQDVRLVDLKVEFGRDEGGALWLADVIDNDSWRIWPGGQRAAMLDKQRYREAQQIDEAFLTSLRDSYAEVAARVERMLNHD
jgi:phosphoribosylaminoimidazole-succinocarboxamide synthase